MVPERGQAPAVITPGTTGTEFLPFSSLLLTGEGREKTFCCAFALLVCPAPSPVPKLCPFCACLSAPKLLGSFLGGSTAPWVHRCSHKKPF